MKDMEDMEIKEINKKDSHPLILTKHYAKRLPQISWAWGLFYKGEMVGVLTIGKPASNSLCRGVCGDEYSSLVYELNRLIVVGELPPNALSFFVGGVMRKMKKHNLIIVSYADCGMNHNGYIYQATNFIYTGKTKSRTDKYSPNGKHSRHYDDTFKHLRKFRTSKHRYIYFTNNKKTMMKHLKYPVKDFPKGGNSKYTLGDKIKTKIIDSRDGSCFYE